MKRKLPTTDLGDQINAEHEAALADAKSAIGHAIACGKLLLQAKAQVARGEWVQWLEKNTQVKPRQSQRYMAIAKNDTMSHLLTDGMRLLEPPQPQVTLEKLQQQLARLDAKRVLLLQQIEQMRAG